jgi:glycine/D-amino acid oxidase-like deaminating enzyme
MEANDGCRRHLRARLHYHRGLADSARRAGALVAEETPVDAITRRAGGFTLRTPRGVVEAREVIVATNGYTGAVTPWLGVASSRSAATSSRPSRCRPRRHGG